MYILYIIILILSTAPTCIYAKKDINSGVLVCIVIASFLGLIGVVYLLYRLIRCKYAKDEDHETERESFITRYGAV